MKLADGPRKIPSTCRCCGENLSSIDMNDYLDLCEKAGKDPFELAFAHTPPGVFCGRCFNRRIAEGIEDKNPMILKLIDAAKEFVRGGRRIGQPLDS